MTDKLPWNERLNVIAVNPHSATIEQIARMATELSDLQSKLDKAREAIKEIIASLKRYKAPKYAEEELEKLLQSLSPQKGSEG